MEPIEAFNSAEMTNRDIFNIISKTIGFLVLCYGLIVGLLGSVLLFAMDRIITGALPAVFSGGWVEIPGGEFHLILVFLITQGILPVALGLIFMGTDIVPDFCFPKRQDKRLELAERKPKKFELSESADKWKPPKF
jgi:hypothetical protein